MSIGIATMPKSGNNELPESKVVPDPKLEKRQRRVHTLEYKLKILAQADNCKHGELGALLRSEGLYSAQLKTWREELNNSGIEQLSKTKPGPTSRLTAEQKQIEKLQAEVSRLNHELEITNGCLDLQKKALHLLDLHSSGKKP
jgi:transposase